MDKKKYSITVEFLDEMNMKDFIDCVNDTDWNGWLEYKIIKNKSVDLQKLECVYQNVRRIIEEYDGENS